MKRLLAVLLFAAAVAAGADARPLTEKDLLRFQWVGDHQLSPDGSQVVFVRTTVNEKKDGYETALWLVQARAGATPRRLTNGPRDTTPRWSPDGQTLAFLRPAGEKEPRPQIHLLPMSGGEPRALTSLARATESIHWSPDGKSIAFTASSREDDFPAEETRKGENDEGDEEKPKESDVRVVNQAIYRFNGAGYADPTRATHIWVTAVDGGKPLQLTKGNYDEGGIAWSPDSTRIYFVSDRTDEPYYDPDDNDIFSVPARGGDIVKVADIDGSLSAPTPSPDGKWLALRGEPAKPIQSYTQPELYVVSTAAGSQPRMLTGTFDNDVLSGLAGDQRAPRGGRGAAPVWSKDGSAVLITVQEQGRSNLARVDAATGALTHITAAKHDLQSFSTNGTTTVALISTPTVIGDLYLVGNGGALTRLTNVNEQLFSELTLTAPEELWYESFDGRRIQTWVQRPPDFKASKKYPLILNIHGGPHAAYGWTFSHEFQWMAAKGYVVLYPNPRGSTTYGQEFGNIIQYRYPGDDHKDLMAGVDALLATNTIDPKRLGITGGSGGGLLTNWAITQTDRFAAAVSQRSIADWGAFWYAADFTLFNETWFRKAPWQDPADYVARSPITHVEKIKTPLMLIEGEEDLRTPPMTGGEMMFRALKFLRKPAVMVRFPGETHELSRSGKPSHRIERLQHIVRWFDIWMLGAKDEWYGRGLRTADSR
ncbi:MAG TPA: S9 family peptidase [Thermoanaerobaculia bacterium]|jgi:dipeptidyl aminopeptidase/acylaminoacyl peptidase